MGVSPRVHAEELDAVRAPVEADPRVEDQGPDVRDEEILRLVFLHVLELELRKLLLGQEHKERDDSAFHSKNESNALKAAREDLTSLHSMCIKS